MKTYHLLISGKVQGVFYRASAKRVAGENGIYGWIKNTPEGFVEAVITGDATLIDTFIKWCKSGPKGAQVDNVVITNQDFLEFDDFKIIR